MNVYIYSPSALNLLKNVGDLIEINGTTMIKSHAGTVRVFDHKRL